MNTHFLQLSAIARAALILSSALMISAANAQTAPPPGLGEETKGTPAIEETASRSQEAAPNTASDTKSESQNTTALGTATVVESRRASGQVYSIELQHSNAPTQYIEETDSDGNIEYKSNDLEETPNLPKWKLGSW
jgi:hypothetical protein